MGMGLAQATNHHRGQRMAGLKALPISKAKTAWGLLADVKRAILREPKRANIYCFVRDQGPEDGGPACGTVGCFAGWVALLGASQHPRAVLRRNADEVARHLLGEGLTYHTAGAKNEWVFNGGDGDMCGRTKPGTVAHANAVVARITKFMRVNQTALKARKLSSV